MWHRVVTLKETNADVFQLLDTYIMNSRELSLNTAACRLLLDIMPGLETSVVFQEKVNNKRMRGVNGLQIRLNGLQLWPHVGS